MLTFPQLMARLKNIGFGGVGLVVWLAIAVVPIVAGSVAIEHWTRWPDYITIPVMMLILFIVPLIGLPIAVFGLYYLVFTGS